MTRFFSLRTAVALAFCAASALVPAGPAMAISESDRPAIEKMIREYLLQNPEILREAMIELQRREMVEEAKARTEAVKANHKLIYESPRGVVIGNRDADVTIVEFFDYNCGYCKRALDDMMTVMESDPKVKFVLKEFPVLGAASVEAAKVAVAVRMQDKDGTKYVDFHRNLLGSRGQADGARARAAAKEAGVDMARLERDLQTEEIDATLLESVALADALNISGTPSYVIGDEVVPGAVGAAQLRQHIASVRKCGKATC